MTAGEFVACQLYVLELFRPLSSLGFSYSQLVGAVTDCADLIALLGTQPSVADAPGLWKAQSGTEKKGYLSSEECRRHIDKACPPGCPIPRERPLLRTVSLPAPRPAIQDDNDLIYRPAPVAVEQVVELHEEE